VNVFAVVNNVAKAYADPEIERIFRETFLHGDGALDGVLNYCELGEKPIAGKLDDSPRMFGNGGINNLGARRLLRGNRTLGVLLH
jgi:hypothetical protein